MSEQPQSIQPPDEPLDPYTLRVILAELDRRPTTPSEEVVSDLLATANPRARVACELGSGEDRAGQLRCVIRDHESAAGAGTSAWTANGAQ